MSDISTENTATPAGAGCDAPIESLLPHRPPFLFVNKLTHADQDVIEGEYTYKPDLWFFKGHFPAYPVVPGVILVETMAQCGGAGLVATGRVQEGGLFLLISVDNAKFRSQVRPGDKLVMKIKNIKVTSRVAKQHGVCYVGDAIAAEADFACMLVPKKIATEQKA